VGLTRQGNQIFGRETLSSVSFDEVGKVRTRRRDDSTIGSRKAGCLCVSSSKFNIPIRPSKLHNFVKVTMHGGI
jgi:hypothetical protein